MSVARVSTSTHKLEMVKMLRLQNTLAMGERFSVWTSASICLLMWAVFRVCTSFSLSTVSCFSSSFFISKARLSARRDSSDSFLCSSWTWGAQKNTSDYGHKRIQHVHGYMCERLHNLLCTEYERVNVFIGVQCIHKYRAGPYGLKIKKKPITQQ